MAVCNCSGDFERGLRRDSLFLFEIAILVFHCVGFATIHYYTSHIETMSEEQRSAFHKTSDRIEFQERNQKRAKDLKRRVGAKDIDISSKAKEENLLNNDRVTNINAKCE